MKSEKKQKKYITVSLRIYSCSVVQNGIKIIPSKETVIKQFTLTLALSMIHQLLLIDLRTIYNQRLEQNYYIINLGFVKIFNLIRNESIKTSVEVFYCNVQRISHLRNSTSTALWCRICFGTSRFFEFCMSYCIKRCISSRANTPFPSKVYGCIRQKSSISGTQLPFTYIAEVIGCFRGV